MHSPSFAICLAGLMAAASASEAMDLPSYTMAPGGSGFVVGQPFALAPQTLLDGSVLRLGHWSGPAASSGTVSLMPRLSPAPREGSWLRLSGTRFDLETTAPASGAFLEPLEASRCAERPSCIGFSIRLEKPLRLEVGIYDQLGVPVGLWSRAFDKAELSRLGKGSDAWLSLGWNGRSAAGRAVASGVYLIRVRKAFDHGETAEELLKVGLRTR